MGRYDVTLYFTGYKTFEVEADNPDEAHERAEQEWETLAEIEYDDILATLERWPEADEITECANH